MKKHHWHAFWHEKLFEKHSQPHCQTSFKRIITSHLNCFFFFLVYSPSPPLPISTTAAHNLNPLLYCETPLQPSHELSSLHYDRLFSLSTCIFLTKFWPPPLPSIIVTTHIQHLELYYTFFSINLL